MDKELFVAEDEDMSDSPALGEYEDTNDLQNGSLPEEDDDPIIQSVPIVHGALPHRLSQSVHVLQYTGRPKNRPFTDAQLKASVKPQSKVVQLKVPMDTLRFYDEARAGDLGTRVETLSLLGVLTSTDGGLYVGYVTDGKLVLLPVDSTAQLRPLFKYIDDVDTARTAQMRQEASTTDPAKQNAVQVLQTASKASLQISTEGPGVGIGSCLKHIKTFNEEEWGSLSWRNVGDSSTTKLTAQIRETKDEPVATTTLFDEFS